VGLELFTVPLEGCEGGVTHGFDLGQTIIRTTVRSKHPFGFVLDMKHTFVVS